MRPGGGNIIHVVKNAKAPVKEAAAVATPLHDFSPIGDAFIAI